MKKIGIIGAMKVETDYLKDLMSKSQEKVISAREGGLIFESGKINGVETVLVQSGVGKVNAALCAQTLITKFNCSHIINTGIAGALGAGLGVMDFVVSTDAVYHDMDATGFGYAAGQIPQMDVFSFEADRAMIDAVKSAFASDELSKGHKMVEGRIATGDQFISEKEAKSKIARQFSPVCVEMEGAAIAHACYLNGTPFVIIRCMSDMADDLSTNGYEFNEAAAAELSAKVVEKTLSLL